MPDHSQTRRPHLHHSVLIAAYNAAALIPKALASLRAQTDADWELIVVEDGSRDGTEQIVRAYAATVTQPVRYENAIVNKGVAAARTRLLSLARGELCSFLDADDYWTPRHLAAARRTALTANADLIVSDISIHDIDANRPLGTYTPPDTLTLAPAPALIRTSAIQTSSSVTLRRSLATRVGPFDPTLRIGEDRDYWLRCALAGARFALTRENTCTYTKHAASTMARTQLWAESEAAFYEKHPNTNALPRRHYRRLHAHALQNQARLLRATDPAKSAHLLARALTLTPLNPALTAQWIYSKLRSPSPHDTFVT